MNKGKEMLVALGKKRLGSVQDNKEEADMKEQLKQLCMGDLMNALSKTNTNSALGDERLVMDVARIFYLAPIKERKYRLKTYVDCFVAREAIDLVVASEYVKSREEAVHVGAKLAREYNMFEHVVDKDKPFQDGYLFFRFNRSEDNFFSSIANASTSCSSSSSYQGSSLGNDMYSQGMEYLSVGDAHSAYDCFLDALTDAGRPGSRRRLSRVCEKLGDAATEKKDYAVALTHFDQALAWGRREHHVEQADSLTRINLKKASAYSRLGQKEASKNCYREAFCGYKRRPSSVRSSFAQSMGAFRSE